MDIACFGPSVHLLKDIICEIATDKKNQITILSKMLQSHNEKSFDYFRDHENITVVDVESKQEKRRWIRRYLQEVSYAHKCKKAAENLHPDIVFLQSCNAAYFQMRWIKKVYKAKTVYNVQDIFHTIYILQTNCRLMGFCFLFSDFCSTKHICYQMRL